MPAFQHRIPLRWSDYDALQHVNNVRYLEFMQDARVALIEAMGMPITYLNEVGQFVARNEIDYLLPIGMDCREVLVTIWVEKVGGASYDLGYEFADAGGKLYAKARTVMVTVDMATQTVVRIPEDQREVFRSFAR